MNIFFLTAELFCLLFGAAFFSGAETAVTALTRTEYRNLKKKKQRTAQLLAHLAEMKDKIVTTALIGTNFVNTLNSSLITAFTLSTFGPQAVPVATAIITVLIIIVAEIFPKALAAERAEGFGKAAAIPLYLCYVVLRPVAAVFSLLSKAVLNVFSIVPALHTNSVVLLKKDLQLLVQIGQEDGALAAGEDKLLQKAIVLQNVKLRNIMTPRTAITAVDVSSSFEQIIERFHSSRFSRLPVYDSEKHEIAGILHYKDILFTLQEQQPFLLSALLRPAVFIPESNAVISVVKTMNAHGQNMVIVIDEHGGVSGLITMDDIIAAVFSSVQDEYGSTKRNPLHAVRFFADSQLILPGDLRLEDCNELLHTDFHSNYYDTIGGFLLEQWGYLPHTSETIMCGRITFTVKSIINRRIAEIIADISAMM